MEHQAGLRPLTNHCRVSGHSPAGGDNPQPVLPRRRLSSIGDKEARRRHEAHPEPRCGMPEGGGEGGLHMALLPIVPVVGVWGHLLP